MEEVKKFMTPNEAVKDFAKWVEENKNEFLDNETRIMPLTLDMSRMAWKHLEYTAIGQGKDSKGYLTDLIQRSFEAAAKVIISKMLGPKALETPKSVEGSLIEEYTIRSKL
jgi:hypothetical protein